MAASSNERGYSTCNTNHGTQICVDGIPRPYIDPDSFEELEASYGRDRRFAYWRERIIDGCDPASLRHLVDDYAADRSRVYRHGTAGPEDPATFAWLGEGYTKDKNAVYCYGRLVAGVDPTTSEVLSQHYLRDANAVYDLEHKIEGVAPADFRLCDERYGTDGSRIFIHGLAVRVTDLADFRLIPSDRVELHYAADGEHVFRDGEIITDADPQSFEPLAGYYARDARAVYYYGYQVPGADPATFTCLERGAFAIDKSNIYIHEHHLAPRVDDFELLVHPDAVLDLTGVAYYRYDGAIYSTVSDAPGFHNRLDADPETFRLLGPAFARDKEHLFYYGTMIAECDPDTFEDLGLGYYRDARSVFVAEHRLEGADPEHFVIDYRGWSRDNRHVWLEADPVPDLSPEGFSILGNYHVRDSRSVFYYDARLLFLEKLGKADPHSFRVIDDLFSKDAERVYYIAGVIEGADPASFEPMTGGFSRDANSVFYHDEQIAGAHVESLRILTPEIALDHENFYFYGSPTPCHSESFTIIDQFFCKDREHVWFEGELLPDVDAPSFEQRTLFYYVDARRVYERETPLPFDPETVRFVDETYAVGPDAVYFLSELLPGADPATFQSLGNNFSKDATHVYFREQPVEGAHAPSFEVVNYLESRDKDRVYAIRGGEVTVSRPRRSERASDNYSAGA